MSGATPDDSGTTTSDEPAATAPEAAAKPVTATAEATKPDPVDDLVTTHHTLKVGRRRLRYTATTGRVVLREEEHKDGTFGGHKARA